MLLHKGTLGLPPKSQVWVSSTARRAAEGEKWNLIGKRIEKSRRSNCARGRNKQNMFSISLGIAAIHHSSSSLVVVDISYNADIISTLLPETHLIIRWALYPVIWEYFRREFVAVGEIVLVNVRALRSEERKGGNVLKLIRL